MRGNFVELEAEQSYLGSLFFLNGNRLRAAVELLAEHHFGASGNRQLFIAIRGVAREMGAADLVLVKQRLTDLGTLESSGGEAYLIATAEFVPSPANVDHYAEIVKEAWERREISERADRLARQALDRGSEIGDVRADLLALSKGIAPAAIVRPLSEIEIDDQLPAGVPTGFAQIDELLDTRGYPSGQITLICAETNTGKTAFMLSSLALIAAKELNVLFATFADLDSRQVKRRLVRNLSGWGKRPDRSLEAMADYDDARRIVDSSAFGGGWDVDVLDAVDLDDGFDVESFCAWLLHRQMDKPYDIAFVDYAQELTTRDRRADSMVTTAQICSAWMNRTARRLKIPVVVGSQVTRHEGKTRAMYSRGWDQKAGLTLEIADDQASVRITKNRFGPKDQVIPVKWNRERVRFEEAA